MKEMSMSRTRTITLTIGSLAAGAVLATGVTGLALAADSTPSPSNSTSTSAPGTTDGPGIGGPLGGPLGGMRGGPGDGRHGGPDGGMRGGILGGPGSQALHGEAVVKAADGTISTIRMIQGTVTAVGADSISVKAEDGYSATFTVDSATDIHTGVPTRPADGTRPTAPAAGAIGDVMVGDVAMVEGTVQGTGGTATEIRSMTAAQAAQLEKERAAMAAQHQGGHAAAGSAANPSATQAG
jgi:hypothetical protein